MIRASRYQGRKCRLNQGGSRKVLLSESLMVGWFKKGTTGMAPREGLIPSIMNLDLRQTANTASLRLKMPAVKCSLRPATSGDVEVSVPLSSHSVWDVVERDVRSTDQAVQRTSEYFFITSQARQRQICRRRVSSKPIDRPSWWMIPTMGKWCLRQRLSRDHAAIQT